MVNETEYHNQIESETISNMQKVINETFKTWIKKYP